jgi:hypothetical protein
MWVFRPLDRAARDHHGPAQFTLVDFLCLIFLAQLPMAVIRWRTTSGEVVHPGSAYVLGWIVCGVLWWAGVRCLSRAGVRQAWRRAVFLALVVPVTILGSMLVLPLLIVVWLSMAGGEARQRPWPPAITAGMMAGVLIAVYACGRYTRWLASAASASDRETASAGRRPDDG